jgi:hypothetical protein
MRESILEGLLAVVPRRWAASGVLAAMMLCSAATAFGGELALGRVIGQPGQPVSVPVLYRQGSGPAMVGLGTDILFDPAALTHPRCSAGSGLAGATQKTVKCAEPHAGVLRLLVFGLDVSPVPDGEVATVTFDVAAGTRRRLLRLRHTPTAADANGKDITLTRRDGAVQLDHR